MAQEMLYCQALNHALDLEMAADDSVFALGEDVGLYGGSYRVTEGLYAKYGEWRVRRRYPKTVSPVWASVPPWSASGRWSRS